jgi:predicted dehydrogenase
MRSGSSIHSRGIGRRRFLGGMAAAGSAAAGRCWWPSFCSAAEPNSPNELLRIGVIGTGVRGKYLIGNLPDSVRVAALCDCATSRMAEALQPIGPFSRVLSRFRDRDAERCAQYQDYRRMLDHEKLDAVIIATPDHHHALAAMLALQAGLDVYLEKPLTLTIREGRRLADMVRRTGRVLQVGSQQRTMEWNRFGCEFLRAGGLGRISRVELANYPGPMTIGRMRNTAPPDGLDWNLFLGPAPLRAYARQLWLKDEYRVGDLLWRGWDLYRDYSGHLMTNWGGHSVDMVQYALGRDDSGPVEIRPLELEVAREVWQNWKHKTPAPGNFDTHRFRPVTMRYEDGVEVRFIHGPDFIRFHGERGVMKMRRNFFETDPPELVKDGPDAAAAEKWKGSGHVARPHLENWLDCIRSRTLPNAPVEAGHRTATVCHLANIARELQRPLRWDPEAERFVDDKEADQLLDRPRRRGFDLPA